MVFDSVVFLFRFLPVILICYFLAPGRLKNVVLVLGSLIFLAWGNPLGVLLLFFLVCVNFVSGRLIEGKRDRPVAKGLFAVTLVLDVSVFFLAKYLDGTLHAADGMTERTDSLYHVGIMLGISVFTLQILSYLVDVYRGEVRAQRNFLDFLLFAFFFPSWNAGPVMKYRDMENQLSARTTDVCSIQEGAAKLIKGLAGKLLIADNLEKLWLSIAKQDFAEMGILTAWMGIFVFALKVYYELSAYSCMAEGVAAIFGFRFPENFKNPYGAASVTDFWKRWYVSVTDWFREYVYLPLIGAEGRMGRRIAAGLTTWALVGIWFGFGFRFVCFGLWHGVFLVLEMLFFKKILKFFPAALGRIYTWVVVLAGWVLFAFESRESLGGFVGALFGRNGGALMDGMGFFLLTEYQFLLVVSVIFCMPMWGFLEKRLKDSSSGYGIAISRLLGKLSLMVLLILSLIYLVTG